MKLSSQRVYMVGLDFGSTTSRFMLASARVGKDPHSGRASFIDRRVEFQAEPVFTPYADGLIEADVAESLVDGWIAASGIDPNKIMTGGAIITGLAAENENSEHLTRIIRQKIPHSVVATADDSSLESWLAFMGSAAPLSSRMPGQNLINLDIGGGTTNSAIGSNGIVDNVGNIFVGARHFRFEPGTYQLQGMTRYGEAICREFGLSARVGEEMSEADRNKVLEYFVGAMEALVKGDTGFFDCPVGVMIHEVPLFHSSRNVKVLFSGGVGEVLYRFIETGEWPSTTFYGDLGVDLAQRIMQSELLSKDLAECIPDNRGIATVSGLAQFNSEVSGSTLFLPNKEWLPLEDLPVVAQIPFKPNRQKIYDALSIIRRSNRGGCIQVEASPNAHALQYEDLKKMGAVYRECIESLEFPPELPIVLLLSQDFGKALGNFASNWRQLKVKLIVIDEVPERSAQFVSVGEPLEGDLIPVSFYGL